MTAFNIIKKKMIFVKPAKTSRGSYAEKDIWLISTQNKNGFRGLGECAPLFDLSIDDLSSIEEKINDVAQNINNLDELYKLDLSKFPAVKFAFETCLLDLQNDQNMHLFSNAFTKGEKPIKINGLVWMDNIEEMEKQAFDKIEMGWNCIKIKIGALDFDAECRLLEKVRKRYSAFKVELRLDANGAFDGDTAKEQLAALKRFEIHSIEQPIKPNNYDIMASLVRDKIMDIALDEELIGLDPDNNGSQMLQMIKPSYIILKPTLLGGLNQSNKWIEQANKINAQWWATSALESNIGLNAISQWVANYNNPLRQGLGTGKLFKKNFDSPLNLEKDTMYFKDKY